jgi:polyisoprenoid-binding protein YceI
MTTAAVPSTPVSAGAAGIWAIDPAHAAIEFSVKHMMVSTVKGHFRGVTGLIEVNESNPALSSVTAAVDVATVDTGVAQRDEHLRSADFFDAERFPQITFRATNIEPDGDNWKMTGDLTIRDVTRPVTFDVEFEGRVIDPWGNDRAGFTASAKINRRDFGVNWNGVIEAGGVVVSDAVKITLNVEFVKQP